MYALSVGECIVGKDCNTAGVVTGDGAVGKSGCIVVKNEAFSGNEGSLLKVDYRAVFECGLKCRLSGEEGECRLVVSYSVSLYCFNGDLVLNGLDLVLSNLGLILVTCVNRELKRDGLGGNSLGSAVGSVDCIIPCGGPSLNCLVALAVNGEYHAGCEIGGNSLELVAVNECYVAGVLNNDVNVYSVAGGESYDLEITVGNGCGTAVTEVAVCLELVSVGVSEFVNQILVISSVCALCGVQSVDSSTCLDLDITRGDSDVEISAVGEQSIGGTSDNAKAKRDSQYRGQQSFLFHFAFLLFCFFSFLANVGVEA